MNFLLNYCNIILSFLVICAICLDTFSYRSLIVAFELLDFKKFDSVNDVNDSF